ncbi:MAG: hypothetical protein JRJ84_00035 [Deltaproteobacteria bacterium]|nr:hypothetical protein [Deltaproteobacteria bacterium]
MSPRAMLMVGAVTTLLFLSFGVVLIAGDRTILGCVIMGLGLLRGLLWLRQLSLYREEE